MKSNKENRREFLKKTGFISMGMAGTGLLGIDSQKDSYQQPHYQHFNMAGYAAPKLDAVRIGIIGIGDRGRGATMQMASIEGVEIKALGDLERDRVEKGAELIRDMGHKPDLYSGNEDEWKKICERSDIDAIIIVTPWYLHTIMGVFAMEHDKHVYCQLPAANSIDECWQLVETSERSRKHFSQTSGSCHDGIQAVNLNMVRKGLFGDLIHAEGNYIHQLVNKTYFFNPDKGKFHKQWRLWENVGRQGLLYPQHGFAPIVQYFHINYGDKIDYMSSYQSNDFNMNKFARLMAEEDSFWEPFVDQDYRGNMNITVLRTVKGRTIVMQHDISSPRPRPGGLLSGSDMMYCSYKGLESPDRYAVNERKWLSEEETRSLIEKYTPPIVKQYEEHIENVKAREAQRSGSRSLPYYRIPSASDWRFIDCLRNGLPMDRDVYEAVATTAITPLSEWSVANQSAPVTYPDFTCGGWETNPIAMDIELKSGGNTGLR